MKPQTILLMTVGVGGNDPKKIESLAHGMLNSIDTTNPNKVIFFGSKDSEKTIESLKEQYQKATGEKLKYKFNEINEIDSFDAYYEAFKQEIQELDKKNARIKIDYTSGTKTMTMTAALISVLFHKKLYLVKGKRGKDGIVEKGTEETVEQNLYKVYDNLQLEKIHDHFNNNRFDTALTLLDDVTSTPIDKDDYRELFLTYAYFDKINHEEAKNHLQYEKFIESFPELKKEITNNIKALNVITDMDHSLQQYYVLSSIINNARRRAEENKIDDAIARLYRSLELIAQIRLENYNQNSSDIQLDELDVSEEYRNILKRKEENGRIKLGLVDTYTLLYELGDSLGEYFKENRKNLINTINLRNSSVLAHGLNYSTKENYEGFYNLVLDFAIELDKRMENFIEETKFPRFIN